jgi:hypothetical protein
MAYANKRTILETFRKKSLLYNISSGYDADRPDEYTKWTVVNLRETIQNKLP